MSGVREQLSYSTHFILWTWSKDEFADKCGIEDWAHFILLLSIFVDNASNDPQNLLNCFLVAMSPQHLQK